MTGAPSVSSDYLIIGAGIMGLAMAYAIRESEPKASIVVIEKEHVPAWHASGRNSGVLHAGFYYTSDSLKARFTREGNRLWRDFCSTRQLPFNPCGKVVVARNENEIDGIFELKKRGDMNGVDVSVINENELAEIEPNAKTTKVALWSPTTTTVNPGLLAQRLEKELKLDGVHFYYNTPYDRKLSEDAVLAGNQVFSFGTVINTAGLHADRVARDFGFASDLLMLPFKGIYLEYEGDGPLDRPLRTNIYPVPDLRQPFLGVHFTIKVDGTIKIGPTAIPALWRENYEGISRFVFKDVREILGWEAALFFRNDFGFRDLALAEIRKYSKQCMINQARPLVGAIDTSKFRQWGRPGIRAQLFDIKKRTLVSDFCVEGDCRSIHVLNAVSPAFTASLPFAHWTLNRYRAKAGWYLSE